MEVKVKYIAKDGREFDDPYDCESYEKLLQKKPGTVGYFLNFLKKKCKETDYFYGVIFYRDKDGFHTYARSTVDLSEQYDGEYITQAMKEAQEQVTTTVKDVINFFEKKDNSFYCGGSFVWGEDIAFSNCSSANITSEKVFNPKENC